MNNFSKRILDLSPEKLALLTLRLKSKDGNVKSTPKIRRRSESKPQTLAPAQQRLWFLNQLEPDKTIYNAALAIRLTGSLNVRALEQSLSEIVKRHEALRTNFHTIEGQPVQVISPAMPIKLPIVNFEEFSATEQEAQALRLATEIAQQPFNLSQGSLFRMVLLRLEQEKHMLFFTVHHIVFDAWSFGVLTKELMMLYKAFSIGKTSPLKELVIQYVDFTEWQWQMISGTVLQTQLSYWKQQLDGLPQLLELPTDRPRPAVQTFRGTTQSFVLPPNLSQTLKDLSYQESVTLFMLLLATFKTLLHYYTGQDDIVVGSSVADRNYVETESLIGFFVNTLVLRTDLSHDPSFRELLARIRKITLQAYAHQNLPFQKLVEILQPERDRSHSPLFQVAFVLQNTPAEPIKLPDLTLVPLPVHNGNVAYDLILLIEETAEGLKGTVEYSTDLFNDTTIERLIRHFTTLLESIVANPKAKLSQLNLLTKEECHQVLINFNDTARNYTKDKKCIHELFEAHVERIPDSIAVVFQQEQLITYQELNRRANQLAHYLREIGIGPDVLVGICMDRSLEMVVGILGILKAGGSYVPLDPAYPLDRLAFILEDTRIPVLLTQEHILENLPNYWATTICIDSDWEIITKQSEENLSSEVSLNNLAYVIYTSGTTGTPKGVMLEHKGVVNLVRWQSDNFNITSQSRISQFASYSFDAAVGETFMALLNGATLVMLDRNDLEPAKLILSINKQAITVLVLVPSILKELNPNLLSNHKITVVAVGEVCSPELALKWADKCKFMNAYGPTEYTVYSHLWQVDKEYVAKTNCVPIGWPIHNTKSYILDSHLNPVPIGVVGEIYISGDGLARGYLNRPDATSKQFIPNKFYESDVDVECLVLSLKSACREIAEFKNNHIAHSYQVNEENKHRSLPKNISSEYVFNLVNSYVFNLVNSLDADLIEKTHSFINYFYKNQAVYEAFLRYLFEGFHCSYASCGINKDVLKLLLPYSDFQGLKGIDFGFGNSEIMQTLLNMGACMKGLDFNPFFIQNGRNLNLDVQMAKVDVSPKVFLTEIGITEGSYDFAISTLILDRLENPFNFIQNLFLVLKEGGKFAIQTLMPVIGVDDGNVQDSIIYTPEQNRITSGESLKQDKASIISLLREVGAGEIKIYQLPYVVSSRDGIQEYEIWSFVGCKRKSQDGIFQKNEYQRLYKTGDLGKYLPNGDIQFCGRVDDLVKIRGFRIELGEIEDVLCTHPYVQEAIVLAKEDTTSHKRLIAYILPSEEKRLLASQNCELFGYKKEETLEQSLPFLNKRDLLSISNLRSFLENKLPRYMVPSAFVMLNSIPRMVNGKVNRQALLEIDRYSYVAEKNFVAPRTSVEKVLAEAWTQVLGLNQVSIHDNIFELGGDSILIVQILAKVNQAGFNLTVSQFFKHQTIAELAPLASSTQINPVAQDIVTGSVPLTPIQHWFFQQNLPEPHHYNQAILLQLRETLNVSLLEATIQSLLVHHDALRLRFRRSQAGWQQINAGSEENRVVLYVDLSMLPKVEQQRAMDVAAAETHGSLNLSEGPLLRVVFFDCGSQQPSYLLVIIHHLAVDGVSWRILLEDLQLVYQNLLRGEQIQLSPKTTSFKQWAESLTQYARSTQLQQELSYWLDKPHTSISYLPVDYPGGNNTEASARTVSVLFSQKETKLLLENIPLLCNAQINEVLLAALVEAVSHWAGERSLLIDLEGHGRENIVEDVDLFRTVGWFTSLFPVWFNLTAISNLDYVLRNVKEQLRSVPNRGVGYGIIRYLYENEEIAKKLQTFPQAEISFNYLGQFDRVLPGLSLFEPTLSSYGPTHSVDGKRCYLLEVNGYVIERHLHIDLIYSENIHKPTTIESLAERFTKALQALIAHCQSFKAGSRTPSDFPLARTTLSKLDWDKLDSLIGYPQQVEDVYPLTPIQQGMLYHTLCAPESGIYVNQLSCFLHGKFDASVFTRAWQEVVKRHPALRTAFVWDCLDEPLQIVYSNLQLHLEEQDWRKLSSGKCEQRLEAYRAEQYRNFKLSEAPLMRMIVVRVAEETYQFVWTFHHLLLDGWSVSLLLKEVFTLYKSSCESQNIKLEESYPFRNYIEWLQQQDLSKAEVFWRQTLKGFTKPKSLLIDRTPGALLKQATNYKEQKIYLSASTTATLQSLARQHQLTLNSIVQGAWALLLSHYTGEKDVVFGSIFSGRPTDLVGIELMAGLFINTLPVRLQVIPEASFLPWLKALQAQQVELRQYEYSPLVEIQGWSEVPRGVPLFESILVFENYPIDSSLLKQNGDLKIEQVRSLEQTNYPLTVVVVPGSELSLAISYSCEHFHASTIAQMLSHFKNLLEGIAMAPARCLSDLPLLTKAERRQQVVKWNNIKTIYPQDLCIHQLFEAQVERTPDSIAIVFEDQSLTYRELNTRANQLAYHLRTLGVQLEVVVGVFMERSLEMVIGLLGILKAGGAYVPLDPAYPKERLVFMLDNTQVPVLLTLQVFVEKLPEHKAQVLCLDADWEEIAQESQENPFNKVTVENLIYVIYTSGSTGRPKGVLGTHQASLNRFAWMWETYPFKTEEVCCQKTSINFVDSVWELFGPLLRGIKTVIIPEKTVKHIDEFIQILADNHVSRFVLVPSLLRAMLDNDNNLQTRLSNLKMWISSGEPFSVDLLQHFLVSMPNKVLLNLYGSSEVAGDVTWYNTSLQIEEYFNPPIGRPIANTQAYILNNQLNPVALGVVGELYIGGTNLARGYLNRSDLTAEKFVPSPFSNNAGARLYKTGDLARYLPDGNIEFIDRIDRQVKLRGFRIELREIETLLSQYLSVQEAIVLVRKDESGDRRLVAYVVPKPNTSPAVSDLQNFLREMLPEYMVPSGFVLLNSFPLTPNGKIDTQALLAMNGLEQELKQAFVAPRTEAERTIAEIWQLVLGIEKVGVNDNFFDRGGHSLLLVKVHGRLQELFKLNLSIVEMFQHPTISSLAEYISRNDDSTPSYQQNAARGKRRKDRNSRQRSR